MELVYIVEEIEGEHKIIGVAERKLAEKANLRHLTTICVPFICDDGQDDEGNSIKGNWIVHNRYHKQVAKGEKSPPEAYNLFGGHTNAETFAEIGTTISEAVLFEGVRKELSEELFTKKKGAKSATAKLEVWEDGSPVEEGGKIATIDAAQYHVPLFGVIPVGFTEYESGSNKEYSYVFALPVPFEEYKNLVAADDYERDGEKHSICLPVTSYSETQLKKLHEMADPGEVEVCDAILRLLYAPRNVATFSSLRSIITENLH